MLNRKLSIILCSMLSFLLLLPSSYAETGETKNNEKLTALFIDSLLTIELHDDGRVAPLANSETLSEKQLDMVLEIMKVDGETISNLPLDLKKRIVSKGGIMVPVHTEQKKYYNSLNGEKHLITDKNTHEIKSIQKKDVDNLAKNTTYSTDYGEVEDGTFYGTSLLYYLGTSPNGAEYEYEYYDVFTYEGHVSNAYKDTIAHAWQTHTTSIGREGEFWTCINSPYGSNCSDGTVTMGNSGSTTGAFMKFSLNGVNAINQRGGYFSDTVRIPKTQKNTTGKWVVKYAHPWSIFTPSVTIGVAGISYSSFIGDEWYWENTFIIGD